MKYRCAVVDDEGKTCGRLYSKAQHKQDGMCSTCADNLWCWFMEWGNAAKDRWFRHYPK